MTTREFTRALTEVFEQSPVTLGRAFWENRMRASVLVNISYLLVLASTLAIASGDWTWWIAFPTAVVAVGTALIEWATRGTIPAHLVAEKELEWFSRTTLELDDLGDQEWRPAITTQGVNIETHRNPEFEADDFEIQTARIDRTLRDMHAVQPIIMGEGARTSKRCRVFPCRHDKAGVSCPFAHRCVHDYVIEFDHSYFGTCAGCGNEVRC